MIFDRTIIEGGSIKHGSIQTYPVNLTNNSKEVVKISNVAASCSCTSGEMNINTLQPDQSGIFTVRFNSNKTGRGIMLKSINISWWEGTIVKSQKINLKVNVI